MRIVRYGVFANTFICAHPLASYGGVGRHIALSTLRTLFPSDSLDSAVYYPLEYDEFASSVLVLEALALLIQDDIPTSLSLSQARAVLRDSCEFGRSLHPHEDGDTPSPENYSPLSRPVKQEPLEGHGGSCMDVIELTDDDD